MLHEANGVVNGRRVGGVIITGNNFPIRLWERWREGSKMLPAIIALTVQQEHESHALYSVTSLPLIPSKLLDELRHSQDL